MPASSRAIRSSSDLLVRLQARGDCALHLLRRHPRLVERARFDKVTDGFRLRQVDAAVQEGPQRELAGLRRARPALERALDQVAEEHRRAVAGNLHHVFACVGVRFAEPGDHHFIQRASGLWIHQGPERGALSFERQPREVNQAGGDLEGTLTGKAHHPQASAARRRCDGHDGVYVFHGVAAEFSLAQVPARRVWVSASYEMMGKGGAREATPGE